MNLESTALIERCAAAVHRAYCENYLKRKDEDYWTGGDYDKLDEETKEIDRATVRAVFNQLQTSANGLNSVDAAVSLLAFTKFNDYPQLFTEKFYELTDLLNAMENALYADGIVKPEVWKDIRKEKSS